MWKRIPERLRSVAQGPATVETLTELVKWWTPTVQLVQDAPSLRDVAVGLGALLDAPPICSC